MIFWHEGAISYVDKFLRTKFDALLAKNHWFPLLEKVDIRAFILPRNFPAVLIIFTGRGGAPPLPHRAGRGGEPPPPRGEGSPRGGAPIPGPLCPWQCLLQTPAEGHVTDILFLLCQDH